MPDSAETPQQPAQQPEGGQLGLNPDDARAAAERLGEAHNASRTAELPANQETDTAQEADNEPQDKRHILHRRKREAPRTASSGAEAQIAASDGIRLPRETAWLGTTTGKDTEFVNWWDTHKVQRNGELTAKIDAETALRNFKYVSSFIQRMGSVQNLDEILAEADRPIERQLFERLAKTVRNTRHEVIERVVDYDKVAEFLQTGEGWATTMMLMEEESMMIKMATGMDAIIRNQAFRGQEDKGRNGKVTQEKQATIPGYSRIAFKNSIRFLSTAGYLTFASGKSKLEFSEDNDLLAAVLDGTDQDERAYIFARFGIDLNAVEIVPEQVTEPNPNDMLSNRQVTRRFARYTETGKPNFDLLKARVADVDSARHDNFAQLGFDRETRDRAIRYAEEFIFSDGQAQPEDIPVPYIVEINRLYRDQLAVFNGTPDKADRLFMMTRARITVMTDLLERDAQKTEVRKTGEATDLSIAGLRKKAEAMRTDEYKQKQKRAIGEEIAAATTKKMEADQRMQEISSHPDHPLGTASDNVTTLIDQLTKTYGVESIGDMDLAIRLRQQTVDAQIRQITNRIDDILEQQIQDLRSAQSEANVTVRMQSDRLAEGLQTATRVGNVTVPDASTAIKSESDPIDAIYQRRLANVQPELDKLRKISEELEAKGKEHTAAVDEQGMAILTQRGKNPNYYARCDEAYEIFGREAPAVNEDLTRTESARQLADRLPVTIPLERRMELAFLLKTRDETQNAAPLPPLQQEAIFVVTDPTPSQEPGVADPIAPDRDAILRYSLDDLTLLFQAEFERNPNRVRRFINTDDVQADIAASGRLDRDDPQYLLQLNAATQRQARLEAARIAAHHAQTGIRTQFRAMLEIGARQEVDYYDSVIKEATQRRDNITEGLTAQSVELSATILENSARDDETNSISRILAMPEEQLTQFTRRDEVPENGIVAPGEGYIQSYPENETNTLMREGGTDRIGMDVLSYYQALCEQYYQDPGKRKEMFDALIILIPPRELRNFITSEAHMYGENAQGIARTATDLIRLIGQRGFAL